MPIEAGVVPAAPPKEEEKRTLEVVGIDTDTGKLVLAVDMNMTSKERDALPLSGSGRTRCVLRSGMSAWKFSGDKFPEGVNGKTVRVEANVYIDVK